MHRTRLAVTALVFLTVSVYAADVARVVPEIREDEGKYQKVLGSALSYAKLPIGLVSMLKLNRENTNTAMLTPPDDWPDAKYQSPGEWLAEIERIQMLAENTDNENILVSAFGRILFCVVQKYVVESAQSSTESWEMGGAASADYKYKSISILSAEQLTELGDDVAQRWYQLWVNYRIKTLSKKLETAYDYFILANEYIYVGDTDNAVVTYKKGIAKFKGDAKLYKELGKLYTSKGMYGFAIDVYLACLEQKPLMHDVRRNLALIYEVFDSKTLLSFGKYKKEAVKQWQVLYGTEYDGEAKNHVLLLGQK
ncbi:MAG: hypothetical protein WC955_07190 [Elusimicrobiota bacterium]